MTATRICAEQGCPLPTRAGSARCAEHHAAHARSKSSRRGYSAHAAGYDAAWSKTSERYLRAHPTCECDECAALPLEQRDRSEEVHHVDGLGPLGPRGHDWSNLLAMSHPHHSRLTATHHRISPLLSAEYHHDDDSVRLTVRQLVRLVVPVRDPTSDAGDDPEGVG